MLTSKHHKKIVEKKAGLSINLNLFLFIIFDVLPSDFVRAKPGVRVGCAGSTRFASFTSIASLALLTEHTCFALPNHRGFCILCMHTKPARQLVNVDFATSASETSKVLPHLRSY